jgi:hypothetical protein
MNALVRADRCCGFQQQNVALDVLCCMQHVQRSGALLLRNIVLCVQLAQCPDLQSQTCSIRRTHTGC